MPFIRFTAILSVGVALCVAATSSPAQDALPAPAQPAAAPAGLQTFEQQISYSLGVNIGRQLQQEGLPIDAAAFAAAVRDVFAGGELQLSDAQRQAAFAQLQGEMERRQEEAAVARMSPQQRAAAEQNKQAGAAFLTQNATQPGVQTTASGLQYKVIQPGTGATPRLSDAVRCNYEGRLINGKVFDASAKHGGPATFPVGRVIAGWTEALQLMKVGAKWELYIPGHLAYRLSGSPPDIGPNETLIFTIELLEVVQR